ncbi:MAG TPA: 2-C-methyl-D-erythritol 2,4-cyclodiphosphate synthase [Gammaproteobacteria bacterium]|nr:2-C-methyl-D-erythritol 2,4-cyclodiphosphate synthase [Gammaproteobacteria bacterium]
MKIRIGHGFDLHRVQPADQESSGIMLGGVLVPYHQTIVAHSDGDVILHAITDALLGALGLGDIGQWFPDTDPKYKNVSSDRFLLEVYAKVRSMHYTINNIDVTVIAQKPKLKNYILAIREKIADLLKISVNDISIKAKTHEGCDSIGEEKALAAHAVVLICSDESIKHS